MPPTHNTSDVSFTVSADAAFWRGLVVADTAAIDHVACAAFFAQDAVLAEDCSWSVLDEPLLWHRADRGASFVNARFFSDLIVADLTALEAGVTVGHVRRPLAEAWGPEEIVRFLLSSSLLRCFVHSHAELRLVQRQRGVRHVERYDGCHVMFTNEEVHTGFGFEVAVGAVDGAIAVAPL